MSENKSSFYKIRIDGPDLAGTLCANLKKSGAGIVGMVLEYIDQNAAYISFLPYNHKAEDKSTAVFEDHIRSECISTGQTPEFRQFNLYDRLKESELPCDEYSKEYFYKITLKNPGTQDDLPGKLIKEAEYRESDHTEIGKVGTKLFAFWNSTNMYFSFEPYHNSTSVASFEGLLNELSENESVFTWQRFDLGSLLKKI